MKRKPVYITGIGEGYSHQYITSAKSVDGVRQGLGRAGRRAMEVAGITPQDLDVAEIYDSFSFTPLIALEGFGVCGPGEAGDWVLEGNAKLGGTLPMNTHGGLIRQAHLGRDAPHRGGRAAAARRGRRHRPRRRQPPGARREARASRTAPAGSSPRRARWSCRASRPRRPRARGEEHEREHQAGVHQAPARHAPGGRELLGGTHEHKLLLPTDGDGTPFWYPRALTPGTLEPVQCIESKGTGTVYTYSVHFIGPSKAYKGDPPHIVALIDLDEGVRMMSNLVKDEEGYPSIDPEDVSIGMRVRVVFHDVTDEITLPKFVAA